MSAALGGMLARLKTQREGGAREGGAHEDTRSRSRTPLSQPSFYVAHRRNEAPESFGMRCWLFLEHPTSSIYARVWSVVVTFTILLSSCTFIVGTLPQYHAKGPHTKHFNGIEYYSIVVFTLEYVGRWTFYPVKSMVVEGKTTVMEDEDDADGSTSASQHLHEWFLSRLRFMRKTMNLVDLLAIVPFYIELILAAAVGSSSEDANALAVIRVVRITRIFRLLKLGKNNDGMEILVQTMKASSSFLVSVLFLMCIITVLYGSIVFSFETASNACVSFWECEGGADTGVDCTILTHFDHHEPNELEITRIEQATRQQQQKFAMREEKELPPLIPRKSRGDSNKCDEQSKCIIVGNICYNEFGAVTNYNSIPNAMWWCLVTMCCVGFGDLAPVTIGGKICGVLTALTGVIVLAMPTTVIGTNFSDIYESYYARKREEAAELGGESENEKEDKPDDGGLPEELKGTNSKHLNRLIVEKQLAAQAKDRGIPQDVINLAFMSNDEVRQEREKVVFDAVDNFGRDMGKVLPWKELGQACRSESIVRVEQLMAQRLP